MCPAKRRILKASDPDTENQFDVLTSRTGHSNRMGKASIFARNLRTLTALRGLKATTAARAIQEMLENAADKQLQHAIASDHGFIKAKADLIRQNPIEARWYRRLMQRGLTKATESTWIQMTGIALYFGVEYEELWDSELPNRLTLNAKSAVLRRSPYADSQQQLSDLLENGKGKYGYLMSLIDSLHAEMRKTKRSR